MSHTGTRRHILCYDIADEKRLRRVHRRVRESGMALQFSVFDCNLNSKQMQHLLGDLRELIDHRHDDVRIYGPRLEAPLIWLGPSALPEGVQLFNNSSSGRDVAPRPPYRTPSPLASSGQRQKPTYASDIKTFSK